MTIGLLEAKFSLPEAHSLKDKRQIVRSMRDRILARMNVSVGEVGNQDFWKSASFAFVTVSAEKKICEKRLSAVMDLLRSEPRMVLLDVNTSYV